MDIDGTRDLNYYHHELYRLTTDTGEEYAFDLSGAQHGHYEPIVPWDSYEKLRVGKVVGRVRMFGETQYEELHRKNVPLIEQVQTTIFGHFTDCLNVTLQDWQTENMSLNILLTLQDQEFERMTSDLYNHIEADLKRFAQNMYQRRT